MKKPFKVKSRRYYQGMLVVYFLVPTSIFLLPLDFFDSDKTIVCISRLLLDRECAGCGLTRSVMHAVHGDFTGAWQYNRLIVVVLPLLTAIWMKDVWKMRSKLIRIQPSESTD